MAASLLECLKTVPFLGILALALSGGASRVQAQEQLAQPIRVWAMGGIGLGTEGFAGAFGFDVQAQAHLISLRAAGVAGIIAEEYWDVGLLYGRAYRGPRTFVAGSAGLGVMDGQRCGLLSSCQQIDQRLSLPAAARFGWRVAPILALGTYLFANINSQQSFGGVVLTVEVGRLGW